MMFYGPSGAGKKTRVMALLRSMYGNGVEKVKLEHRTFATPSGKNIEVTTVASNYHIEINPGDAGIYDRYVVQELIKEMAAYTPVADTHGRGFKGMIYVYIIKRGVWYDNSYSIYDNSIYIL